MANDPNTYKSPVRAIGNVEEDAATNSTDAWSIVSLLKGIYHLLSGTLHVDFTAAGIATAANQVTGNNSLAAIDGHVDGLETAAATQNVALASIDTTLVSIKDNADTLETATGIVTETAPASDTASSGLNGRLQRIAQRLTSLIALLPASIGAKTAAGSLSVTTATDDNTLALFGALTETAPASDTASSGLNGRLQRAAQLLTSLRDNCLSQLGSLTETAPASDTASSGLNGRAQRVAQRLTSLIALLPTSLGAKTAAASLSVTTATDDNTLALLGAVTETAPATDTASSGQNGRLQRIAQRITSLIALFPTSLGTKTAAGSLAVTLASDDVIIAPVGGVTETAPASDTASSGLNGRLQRIAQRITSLIALVPASLGAKTAAASFAITTATDDNTLALYGAVTEIAPATDTASSGLNGRLQRIAQRLTSMIALLPAALGAGGGLKIDGSGTALPVSQSGTWTMQPGNTANTTAWKVDGSAVTQPVSNAGTFAVQATIAAGAATIGKTEDAQSADADVGVPAMAVRTSSPANRSDTQGDYEILQMFGGRLWVSAILEAGAALLGKVGIDQTTPGTTNAVAIASPAGTRVETTVATGGTAINLFGTTPTNGFEVINTHATEWLYIRENGTATVVDNSTSTPVAPRSSYTTPVGYKPTADVSCNAGSSGHAVIGRRW